MAKRYKQQPVSTGVTRFTRSPMVEVEFSKMTSNPTWLMDFNAGDIIPVYYNEILPHETMSVDVDFVIRQMTALFPTMGKMQVDFFAYFVPNRIINESWKNVQGENTSGFWVAPEVSLAPLYIRDRDVQVPVGSIADYYGFPTQAPIQAKHLQRCNDLKFRGYLEIYNHYFRSENYTAPIPYSKLNLYNGFFEGTVGLELPHYSMSPGQPADGSYPAGAIQEAVYGAGSKGHSSGNGLHGLLTSFNALGKPLKANKLHDFITSGLPSPQKGAEVYFGIGDTADVDLYATDTFQNLGRDLKVGRNGVASSDHAGPLVTNIGGVVSTMLGETVGQKASINSINLKGLADLSTATGISVNDLRTAVATQQVYEALARGGSRYVETLRTFFEIETENPFLDIPTELGHIRRDLDLYQVAQTSASQDGSTPQGELTAFGYTTSGGNLFTRTFLEHGYVHILAVVRQRNVYSTYFAPDNFRLSTLDFYLPQFSNIGEQPIRLATLNPFIEDEEDSVLAYQEAWWEYRYEPDRVHGHFRSGVDQNLSAWTYADDFDPNFKVVTGEWLKSNAEQVLNRTIAVTSDLQQQFKGLFSWRVIKQLPMPTYGMPGLDTI